MRNFRLRFFIVFGLLLSIVSSFTYVSGKYVMTTPSLNLALDVNARFDIGFNPNGGKLNIDEPDESWLDVSEDSLHKVVTNGEVYGAIPTAKKDGYDLIEHCIDRYDIDNYIRDYSSKVEIPAFVPKTVKIKVKILSISI